MAMRYTLLNYKLYMISTTALLLRCLAPSEVDYVLREIQEGIFGNYLGQRTMAHKALTLGYYWHKMLQEAKDLVRKCDKCQRYGIPRTLVNDNGTQFEGEKVKKLCANLNISHHYSAPRHPQSNGQAKVTNLIYWMQSRKSLKQLKDLDIEIARNTMGLSNHKEDSNRETPFALAFGSGAMILVELGMPTLRMEEFELEDNGEALRVGLDLLEERRDIASIKIAAYQ